MRRRETLVAWLFIVPALFIVGLFVAWPAVNTFRAGMYRIPLTERGAGTYVGADNFRELFSDPDLGRAGRNTALFAVMVVPSQTVLALVLALWVHRPGRSTRALRLMVFIPAMLSMTVLSVLWKLLYEPVTPTGMGLINGLLTSVGLPAQPFLISARQALPAIALMTVWQGAGLFMLIFLSALQEVPETLYQAALLDGAGRWRRFVHVTLPAIAPTAVFVVMITTIFAMRLFVQPYLMTRGGPAGSTMSMVQYVYETAFVRRALGLACAAGAVFFVAVTVIALVQRWSMRAAEALR